MLGLYGWLLLRAWLARARPCPLPEPLPRVSILVAARDQAPRIERCLRALAALDYPPACLEILIGDDASTDDTAAVVRRFTHDKPRFRLLPMRHRPGAARGKSNVLAHRPHAATTDYFFITDADMRVSPDWVTTLPAGGGVVTGITTAEGNLFGRLQGLDWLFGLSLVRVLTDWGLRVAAVGNNMLVPRNACETTGGYKSLEFSLTATNVAGRASLRGLAGGHYLEGPPLRVGAGVVSCFLFLVSCFLFLVSCFLFLVSCFLFLVSCFLFLVKRV